MVDAVAVLLLPLGGPALELVPCLGLAILGVAAGLPHHPPDASSDPPPGPPDVASPWTAPAEPSDP